MANPRQRRHPAEQQQPEQQAGRSPLRSASDVEEEQDEGTLVPRNTSAGTYRFVPDRTLRPGQDPGMVAGRYEFVPAVPLARVTCGPRLVVMIVLIGFGALWAVWRWLH